MVRASGTDDDFALEDIGLGPTPLTTFAAFVEKYVRPAVENTWRRWTAGEEISDPVERHLLSAVGLDPDKPGVYP